MFSHQEGPEYNNTIRTVPSWNNRHERGHWVSIRYILLAQRCTVEWGGGNCSMASETRLRKLTTPTALWCARGIDSA